MPRALIHLLAALTCNAALHTHQAKCQLGRAHIVYIPLVARVYWTRCPISKYFLSCPPAPRPFSLPYPSTSRAINLSPKKSAQKQQQQPKSKSWLPKIGAPISKLSNKLGAEAFWPSSLNEESDNAARILRSFCINGFITEQRDAKHDHKKETRLDHIPPEVWTLLLGAVGAKLMGSEQAIRNCQGLAIFTVMRLGLHWLETRLSYSLFA